MSNQMKILQPIKTYLRKRRELKEWKKEKRLKWIIEEFSEHEINRRLKTKRVRFRDAFHNK